MQFDDFLRRFSSGWSLFQHRCHSSDRTVIRRWNQHSYEQVLCLTTIEIVFSHVIHSYLDNLDPNRDESQAVRVRWQYAS